MSGKATIIFFPGWTGLPKQSYNPLLKRFEGIGVKTHTIPYKMGGFGSIHVTARRAQEYLKDNHDELIFIGHSMGGLVARYMIQTLHWEPAAYVSLGTPHTGVSYYDLIPDIGILKSAHQMRTGSPFIEILNSLPWPPQVPAMTLEAQWDPIVPNARYSPIERAEKIPHTEHASLLWSQRTFWEIAAFLGYELNLISL